MRVALVGCPKTGKTKFARSTGLKVVDNIPQNFSRRTGLAIGRYGDYRVNIALAALRWEEEVRRGEDFVATTTIIDSMFYSTLGIEIFELKGDKITEDLFVAPYYFTTLYLINFFRESWKFDKTIFFPYTGKDTDWIGMDDIYLRILDSYRVKYETLND